MIKEEVARYQFSANMQQNKKKKKRFIFVDPTQPITIEYFDVVREKKNPLYDQFNYLSEIRKSQK